MNPALTAGKDAMLIDLLAPRNRAPLNLKETPPPHAVAKLTQRMVSSASDLEMLLPPLDFCDGWCNGAYLCHTMLTLKLLDGRSSRPPKATTLAFVELASLEKAKPEDGRTLAAGLSSLMGVFKHLGKRRYLRSEESTTERSSAPSESSSS